MPNESEPDYTTWKDAIAEELTRLGAGAVLVGHSIGGSIVIKWLCEGEMPPLAAVFLVAAPFWRDDEIWRWEEVRLPPDASARLPASMPLFLYHGRDDEVVPYSHVEMYAEMFPQAIVRGLRARNHQLNDDLSEVARDIELHA
jgi:predicted alpha/beta hydrolase family esterase